MPVEPLDQSTAILSSNGERRVITPLLLKLIVLQLVIALVWVLMLAAYSVLISPRHQQHDLNDQAQALAQVLREMPSPMLQESMRDSSLNPVLQSALSGNDNIVAIDMQVNGRSWIKSTAPQYTATKTNAKPVGQSQEFSYSFSLTPPSDGSLPKEVTLVLHAIPRTIVHGYMLAGGWLLTFLAAITGLLAINRQLQNESSGLARLLQASGAGDRPQETTKTITKATNVFSADNEPSHILLPVLAVAVERAAEKLNPTGGSSLAPDQQIDVSRRELELAQQSAVRANRIKSNIISTTSHELLTPLNSITGFSKILADDLAPGTQQQEFAQLISENAEHLNTLVNDLIVFSDRETNAVKIHYAPTAIYALLTSIAKSFAPAIAEQGLAWHKDFTALKTISFDTDAVRLRQIVSNLLTNALRNTQQGYVRLAANLEVENERAHWLKISISDSGCGIAKENQQSIFGAFVSGSKPNGAQPNCPATTTDTSTDTETENITDNVADSPPNVPAAGLGFGLGLAIVDDLCNRMGARIELQSEPNQGSIFTVRLPARNVTRGEAAPPGLDAIPAAQTPTVVPADQENRQFELIARDVKALVVDDNKSNRILLCHLLNSIGYSCDDAQDAEQALQLMGENDYAILFVDIRMAPINGVVLLNHIRQIHSYRQTPAIACTAHSASHEHRQLIDSGFDAVLQKPINAAKLNATCRRFEPGSSISNAEINAEINAELSTLTNTEFAASINSSSTSTAAGCEQHAYDVQAAIEHCGGSIEVAREICSLIMQELASALEQQSLGFNTHNEMLEHFHRMNGSASMGGTAALKQSLHKFETLLKNTNDLTSPKVVEQKKAIEIQQKSLLEWLQQQNLDELFG